MMVHLGDAVHVNAMVCDLRDLLVTMMMFVI
jgi:hypothetical protein